MASVPTFNFVLIDLTAILPFQIRVWILAEMRSGVIDLETSRKQAHA
jgi:hypothetical protein